MQDTHKIAVSLPEDGHKDDVYQMNYKVQIFDTDCYGVMWHGAYTKWLEMSRVGYLEALGPSLKTLSEQHDIIFPVYEQNFRYIQSARLDDKLQFRTSLKIERPKWVFTQNVFRVLPDGCEEQVLACTSVIVLINGQGKVYRHIPEVLQKALD